MAMFPGDFFGYSRKGGSGDPSLEFSVGTGCTKKVIFKLVALIPKQMPSKKRLPPHIFYDSFMIPSFFFKTKRGAQVVCQVDLLENSQNGKTGGLVQPQPPTLSASHDPGTSRMPRASCSKYSVLAWLVLKQRIGDIYKSSLWDASIHNIQQNQWMIWLYYVYNYNNNNK